jgi:serine-type D-Ala-D-Ala carboxypeptidase
VPNVSRSEAGGQFNIWLSGERLTRAKPSNHTVPLPGFHDQDVQFARAFQILHQAIDERAFPGASLAVTHHGRLVLWKGLGRFTYDVESPGISPVTIYDIASVTKVVAATTMAMMLYERGKLDLEAPVVNFFPQFAEADSTKCDVTLRMLLAHSSGLPAYERLFQRALLREDLIDLALTTPLAAPPGTRVEYSDIGFIILGEILGQIAGERIDQFCQREIFSVLDMSSTRYRPPIEWKQQIPPTVNDATFRRRVVQGEVHDENASVMQGVSAHAGVFSSALDLSGFAHCMLNGGDPILKRETVEFFTRRELFPEGTSRALGWDTPSAPSQSGGHLSTRTFGHLGYTGTSLWIDPEQQLSITMLTNRTWPDCTAQGIKRVRPQVHDAILEALNGGA